MNHWDARAESLLELARLNERVPDSAKCRVRASLMASIALSGAAASVVAAPAALAKLPAAVKAASSVLPVAAAATVSFGPAAYLAPLTIGLALGLSAVSPSEIVTPIAPMASANALQLQPPRQSAARGVQVAPRIATVLPEAVTKDTVLPATVTSGKAAAGPNSLAAEASLIEQARLVLRQGDLDLTLRLLDQHRHEFPNGVLFFEALATRATALCRQGKAEEGRLILGRLEATTLGSGSLVQVHHACGAEKEAAK